MAKRKADASYQPLSKAGEASLANSVATERSAATNPRKAGEASLASSVATEQSAATNPRKARKVEVASSVATERSAAIKAREVEVASSVATEQIPSSFKNQPFLDRWEIVYMYLANKMGYIWVNHALKCAKPCMGCPNCTGPHVDQMLSASIEATIAEEHRLRAEADMKEFLSGLLY